jgi:hypothetical protein
LCTLWLTTTDRGSAMTTSISADSTAGNDLHLKSPRVQIELYRQPPVCIYPIQSLQYLRKRSNYPDLVLYRLGGKVAQARYYHRSRRLDIPLHALKTTSRDIDRLASQIALRPPKSSPAIRFCYRDIGSDGWISGNGTKRSQHTKICSRTFRVCEGR